MKAQFVIARKLLLQALQQEHSQKGEDGQADEEADFDSLHGRILPVAGIKKPGLHRVFI